MTRRFVAALSLVALASCGELLSLGDPSVDVPATPEAGAIDPGLDAAADASPPPAPIDDSGKPAPKSFLEAVGALEGLVAHWRLDDGSAPTAADRIGQNHGVYFGATSAAPSLVVGDDTASARRFVDGGSLGVSKISIKNGLNSLSAELTVGAIVRAAILPARPSVVVSATGVFRLWLDGNRPTFTMSEGSTSSTIVPGAVTFQAHTTHLMVATFSATSGKAALWVDGVREEQDRTAAANALAGALCIAGEDNAACRSNLFDGVIDEVFVAEKAAREEQIKPMFALVKK